VQKLIQKPFFLVREVPPGFPFKHFQKADIIFGRFQVMLKLPGDGIRIFPERDHCLKVKGLKDMGEYRLRHIFGCAGCGIGRNIFLFCHVMLHPVCDC